MTAHKEIDLVTIQVDGGRSKILDLLLSIAVQQQECVTADIIDLHAVAYLPYRHLIIALKPRLEIPVNDLLQVFLFKLASL